MAKRGKSHVKEVIFIASSHVNTMSRAMSRGDCGLRKSSGSLSTDEWACVPTQLVVWPETSQHQCLPAVGWGQVLA